MTQPELRAHLHALFSELLGTAPGPQAVAHELLAEAVAASVVAGSRPATVTLLRRIADQLDGANG